ncbi:MAG: hypothetical protein J5I92_01770 [Thiogranum sp.]|nr:hypothetical protein [Thiogranum sp.]
MAEMAQKLRDAEENNLLMKDMDCFTSCFRTRRTTGASQGASRQARSPLRRDALS